MGRGLQKLYLGEFQQRSVEVVFNKVTMALCREEMPLTISIERVIASGIEVRNRITGVCRKR
jgi:hypothetical protein